MKVAIDISQIVYGTGVSTYTKNLVENLILENDIEYTLFGGSIRQRKTIRDWYRILPSKTRKKLFYFSPEIADFLWNRIHLISIDPFIGSQDILHSSDWSQPRTKAIKVTTVHDLAPIKFPEYTPKKIVEVHNRRLSLVKKEVDAVIVPSISTKDDLIEIGFENEKVHVIPEAPDNIYKKSSDERVLKTINKYDIHRPYFLSVGTGPRKNTARILKAFANFNNNYELVITGRQQNNNSPIKNAKFIGYIPTAELVDLYSGADALIYPSIYEGFGLPILDAFVVGCPVVTSNISSMVEVAEDGAVLVDPHSIESISEGIKKCIKNKESLVKKGKSIALKYSWTKTAKETIKLYHQVKQTKGVK